MLIPSGSLGAITEQLTGSGDRLRVAAVDLDLDPLAFVRAGASGVGWTGYFGIPGGEETGCLGVAWTATARSGTERFGELAAAVAGAGLPDTARLLFGFSFSSQGPQRPEWDGFPPAIAVLPLVTATRGPRGGRLIVAVPPGRLVADVLDVVAGINAPPPARSFDVGEHVLESRPAPLTWQASVDDAVAAIRGGSFRKVVLARSVIVRTAEAPDPLSLVSLLRDGYPQCYAFGWQQGGAVHIGASPELLITRAGDEIHSHPLAGSAPRGEGEEDDVYLGEFLMASQKDRSEHALVVEDVANRLRPLTTELDVPSEPSLRKMATVQHLSTHIRGRLVAPRSVIELAGVLHPTPAVGGTPRDDALAFVEKIEEIDRGWYGGGLGWMDAGGDGEVALSLRCGLIRDTNAHLYAGAGIVSGSDPEAELAETRLKFRPLLDLLSAT